jgi:hypothetical protein
MTLPNSFETSTNNGFSAIVDFKAGTQIVYVVGDVTFFEMIESLTPEAMASRGVKITSSAPYKYPGLNGVIYTGTQEQGGKKVNKKILILGDETKAYMFMAIYAINTPHSEILGYLKTLKI